MITNNLNVVAAICGNFWQESTVNPGIWEGLVVGNPGYGLGQWTDNPPLVTRRTALFNWLSANGYAQDSGEGQLAFLVAENIWVPSLFQQSAYNTLSDFFASTSTNLSDLTHEWMYHWEGINDGTFSQRYGAAQDFLQLFQNDPGNRDPWRAGNYYLSTHQADMNALLIMDYFLGTTPPGPGPQPSDDELLAIIAKARRNKQKGGIFILW